MISSAHRQPKIIAAKIIIEIKGFPWNHFFGSRAVRSGAGRCPTIWKESFAVSIINLLPPRYLLFPGP